MKIIKVDDHIYIHCKDEALYKYIKKNYVDDITDPKNEELLDNLSEIAGDDGVIHAHLTYDTKVEDWYMADYDVQNKEGE